MQTIKLPYYTDYADIHVEDKNLKAVLTNKIHEFHVNKSEADIVRESLANPIGSLRLRELAKGKNKVLLVTSDHTRAVPSKLTLPILLAEIRAGSPEADITILIATGLHRATTVEEQRKMFGDAIVEHEKIIVHDAFDDNQMQTVCGLPSGASFVVNKLALETELLVCEGFIEPHFFAGFSGGRKSILPGISSAVTVNENHSSRAIADPNSRGGILQGNVIHEDMIFAAKKIGVDFILNVALDSEKKVIAAFAGDLERAHEQGCEFVLNLSRVPAVTGDIVVTTNGGYPLDQNLYQCPKAATTAEVCAGEDGIIILVASCMDGIGGTHFEKLMLDGTPQEIFDKLMAIPPQETIPEQWCVQTFSQMLLKHPIILVSSLDPELVKKLNMIPASSPDEALKIAYSMKGSDADVVIIPDGVSVMAVPAC